MTDLLAGVLLTTAYDTVGTACSSWAPPINNPVRATDGDDASYSQRPAGVKKSHCAYRTIWIGDLSDTETVGGYRLVSSHVGDWSIEWASSPSGPWTAVATFLGNAGTLIDTNTYEHIGSFTDEDARYWRAVHSYGPWGGGGISGIQYVNLYTWELYAGEPPEPEPEPEEPNPDGYEPPEPGRAIVEIFVDDPLGAKWGVAEWGEAVWPTAGWEPIDHLSLRVDVTTGTNQGDLGILAAPAAGSFLVDTRDPDRELDAGNPDSPYAGQLVPNLPIRVNHRSTTFRTAWVQTIEHSLALGGGRITAADSIAILANTAVPGDSDLADTLWARAQDAIDAAGTFIILVPLVGDDPALASYTPPGADETVNAWDVIASAALEALHIPYIDRDGRLGFRAWDNGLERGRSLEAPSLMDIVSWVSFNGLYSVVRALDPDGVTVHEREATPTPRYGKRTYERAERTLDAEEWAERVLADRRAQTLRYRPGEVRPLTADDVEDYGTLEVGEGVDLIDSYTDPPIHEHIRILGSRLTVVDETKDPNVIRSRWRFTYSTSAAPPIPLLNDDDPSDMLTEDGGGDFLYAG